jgi:hypothetical protein
MRMDKHGLKSQKERMMTTELAVIEPRTIPRLDIVYDTERLRKICQAKEEWFHSLGTVVHTMDGVYVYIDRGSPVLGVAHLDYVANNSEYITVEWEKDGQQQVIVWNGALDDRLGVFLLLDVLPHMGMDFDVLLTTGEESGMSTGAHFEPSHDYNWMFQFDRRGTDVVMYCYKNEESKEQLKSIGLTTGWGSVSDISYMEHMGVLGFNFGTGYYDEHTSKHHAVLTDTEDMAWAFQRWYWTHRDTHMEYTPKKSYTYTRRGAYGYGMYNDGYDDNASWDGEDDYQTGKLYWAENDGTGYEIEYELDWDEYEYLKDRYLRQGMEYKLAEDMAWDGATWQIGKTWTGDKKISRGHVAIVCELCGCLTDLHDMSDGICRWCWQEEDIAKIHRLTDQQYAKWETLHGGG